MKITAVRRKEDGRLADIQIVEFTVPDLRIKNAQAEHGGRKTDWEVIEIDEGLWSDYNPRSEQFLNFDENGIAALTQTEAAPEPELEPEPSAIDMPAKIQELEDKIVRLEAMIQASIRT